MPSIDIDLNARAAERNLRTLGAAFDDVADAADDAMRDTERGGDRMERSLRDIVQEARKTEKAVADVGDGAGKAGADVERGMKRAEDGVSEFKDEANSTAREAAASFDGSATSIGDAFQEVVANAFGGFGPAGAAAGIAAAAGLGAVLTAFNAQQEELGKLRQRFSDVYRGAAEDGRAYLDTAQIIAEQNDLIFNPERAGEWKQVQKDANQLGLDRSVVIAANAGDLKALGEVEAAIADRRQTYARDEEEALGRGNAGISEEVKLTNDLANRWETKGTAAVEAQRNAEIATEETTKRLREEVEAAKDATRQVDEFGNELYTLPDGKQIVVSAHTGKATTDVSTFKGDLTTIPSEVVTNVRLRADTSDFDRKLSDLQRRANAGQAVVVPVRMGKVVY